MEDDFITFKNWETEEEETYILSFSHPSEHKTDLLCPLDNTPIIYAYDDLGKTHFCPNCHTNYNHKYNTQESVNEFFQEYLTKSKKELAQLDKKRTELSFFIEKAEESLKMGKNNKANLSAIDRNLNEVNSSFIQVLKDKPKAIKS